MNYTPEHAAKALEIVERLRPTVTPRPEYSDLIRILRDPARWKDGHDVFNRIRVNITLRDIHTTTHGAEIMFAFIAECAAKTAYNCSGDPAPFDNDSFEKLLRSEAAFLIQLKDNEI